MQDILQSPVLDNGMLKFNDENHFSNYVNYLAENKIDLDTWESNLGFASLRTTFRSDLANVESPLPIEHPQFASVLNSNNAIIVQPWILRLDPVLKKVYVLHISKMAKLGLLLGTDQSDSDIGKFTFDDDVFDLLNGSNPAPAGAKGENCSATRTAKGSVGDWTAIGEPVINAAVTTKKEEHYKAIYRYNGYGMFKTLFIYFQHREATRTNKGTTANPVWSTQTTKSVAVNHDYTYDVFAKQKNNPNTTVYTGAYLASISFGILNGSGVIFSADFNTDFYRSWQCLSKYDMNAILYFESSLKPGTVYSKDLGNLSGS